MMIIRSLLLAALLCHISLVHASGFFVAEQSVSSLGTANAANTAAVEDATTAFSNPAGMVFLPNGNNSVIGCFILVPSSHYRDLGTINMFQEPFQFGTNGCNGGETATIPNFAYVKTMCDNLAFGVSVNSPWGLTTDWGDDWYGRYYATHSRILTVNINPTVAFKLNSCFSIGIGFNATYLDTDLRNNIDFGAFLAQEGFIGAYPELQDGKAKVTGSTWAYGGNIGFLYQMNCDTRFGVQYRSQQRIVIDNGKIKYSFKDVPHEAISILRQQFVDTCVRTKITLPDMVSFGAWHRFQNCLEAMADIQWTNWNTINKLKLKMKVPEDQPYCLSETCVPLAWKDTWRFAMGLKYPIHRCLSLRLGYAYDMNPTPNAQLRTPRLPDEDRQWFACGLSYWLNDTFTIDFAYAHIFFTKDAEIDKRPVINDDFGFALAGGLYGKFHQYADIFGLSISSSF